ncbi:MAG: hypothetical protein WBF77_00305 [Sulfurimonadaceae bacterium]
MKTDESLLRSGGRRGVNGMMKRWKKALQIKERLGGFSRKISR